MFIRSLPKEWGYFIACGVDEAIDLACSLRFNDTDIAYLRQQDLFTEEFLNHLKEFKFDGDIHAVPEGTPVFPNEPILRITGKRGQVQLVESLILNTINPQTLIASKASRIVNVANPSSVVDFGLRRAQGKSAALRGARAAYIGGAVATSNVLAGKNYDIPIRGTHAHSFVMSYPTELEAFRAYARHFPDSCVLLVDTYSVHQGILNAITVGKELQKDGHNLVGIRLDSGDLISLSKWARLKLNTAGLNQAKIFASNDLNEYKIKDIQLFEGAIDVFGVGTEMITAKPQAALSGVYKLVQDPFGPRMKKSPQKKSYPGIKNVVRKINGDKYIFDTLCLEEEKICLEEEPGEKLLKETVVCGERLFEKLSVHKIRKYSLSCVDKLQPYLKAVDDEALSRTEYTVEISDDLKNMIESLSRECQN